MRWYLQRMTCFWHYKAWVVNFAGKKTTSFQRFSDHCSQAVIVDMRTIDSVMIGRSIFTMMWTYFQKWGLLFTEMCTYLQWCTFDARKTGRSIFTEIWTYFQQWRHHYLRCGHIYDDALLALERSENRYLQRYGHISNHEDIVTWCGHTDNDVKILTMMCFWL